MIDSRLKKYFYLRNFIFGVEDGLVSTIGLLSGISIVGVSKKRNYYHWLNLNICSSLFYGCW